MTLRTLLFILLVHFGFIGEVFSKDFGIKGPVYEIAEKNLLSLMRDRFQEMQQNGEWGKFKQSIQGEVESKVKMPKSVKGITPATQSRSWEYDPTWTLQHAIVDEQGRLIARKGQTVNPLDYIPLLETLVFVDATLDKEIHYLEKMLLNEKKTVKIVLINGNVADLAKRLNRPIYFDQRGQITERFGIKHTPGLVRQQGRVLAIEEIAL